MEHFIQGFDRHQMMVISFDQMISQDSYARLIDAFVDGLDLEKLGFAIKEGKNGRPPYQTADMIKLFIYGYMDRNRSSRRLEKACQRNQEVIWLLKGVQPKYWTIAAFRRENHKALVNVFRSMVDLIKLWELVDGDTVAIDSFKIRAQNSKKNNYNDKRLKRLLERIEEKVSWYFEQMEKADNEEDRASIRQAIQEQEARKEKHLRTKEQLDRSEEDQISTVDPDARSMKQAGGGGTQVGYSIQTAVDEKHKMVTHFEVTNQTDRNALGPVAASTREILEVEEMKVIADKGYYNAEQIDQCKKENIDTYVAPRKANNESKGKYKKEHFQYCEQEDCYICPQGEKLTSTTNGQKSAKSQKKKQVLRQYSTPACQQCPVKDQCTSSRKGRIIRRSNFETAREENDKRIKEDRATYLKRGQIVEHPFGTIKRSWGYDYTLLKGKEKVGAELALIFTAYNMRRLISIMGVKRLLEALEASILNLFHWCASCKIMCGLEVKKKYRGIYHYYDCRQWKSNSAFHTV